jgi:hypothetical protein
MALITAGADDVMVLGPANWSNGFLPAVFLNEGIVLQPSPQPP